MADDTTAAVVQGVLLFEPNKAVLAFDPSVTPRAEMAFAMAAGTDCFGAKRNYQRRLLAVETTEPMTPVTPRLQWVFGSLLGQLIHRPAAVLVTLRYDSLVGTLPVEAKFHRLRFWC